MRTKEAALMNELRKDCRESLTELCHSTDVPVSSGFRMLQRLEKGFISKHACFPDFARLGFPLKAGIFLNTQDKAGLADFLESHPNINTLLRISGDFSFYAEFLFRNMAEYDEVMNKMTDSALMSSFSVHFLTDVKQEDVCLPIGER